MKKMTLLLGFAVSLHWGCANVFADISPLPPGVLSGLTLRQYLVCAVKDIEPPPIEEELRRRACSPEAIPILCEILSENMDNSFLVSQVMYRFLVIDGKNMASHGDKKVLRLAREIALQDTPPAETFQYLALKGDGSDLAALAKRSNFTSKGIQGATDVLRVRASGTNIVGSPNGSNSIYLDFIPSVANTGPQGVYAYHIIWKAYEMAGKDLTKIPEELLTMVVSFDADGNPVCNVDLAKHGLSMPVITPKPNPNDYYDVWSSHEQWKDRTHNVIFPHEAGEAVPAPQDGTREAQPATADVVAEQPAQEVEPPPHQEEPPPDPPQQRRPAALIILALACAALTAVWFLRKRNKR